MYIISGVGDCAEYSFRPSIKRHEVVTLFACWVNSHVFYIYLSPVIYLFIYFLKITLKIYPGAPSVYHTFLDADLSQNTLHGTNVDTIYSKLIHKLNQI